MPRTLNAFTLIELLIASVVSTALFFAATATMRSYNQVLSQNFALAQLRAHHSIVETVVTRLVNNAGHQNFDNGVGNHAGCYLDASANVLSIAYDTLTGARERVDLDLLLINGLYRGFDAGNGVLEFSIFDWNSSSNQYVFRNRWGGPLVEQVEGFFVSAEPGRCNPEFIVIGLLIRGREQIYRTARTQSFSSDYFSVPTVSSRHMHAYNEFLIAPKNVILK